MNITTEKKDYLKSMIEANEGDFLKAIRDRLGLLIHKHQMKEVYKIIQTACIKFQCEPFEYLTMLKKSKVNSPIFEDLILGITVGETYFFRDKAQMELLKNHILPKIIFAKRNKNDLSLRIWSAGCASGEEIYTIAMMLTEMIEDLPKWNLHLLGTDINTTLLKKATLGTYKEWSMRSISDDYKNRYFTKQDNCYLLVPKIRDMVNFGYLNLTDKSYATIFNETNAEDLIICRNVLIYFDNQIISEVMQKFARCIAKTGVILLGSADPILTKDTNLIYEYKLGTLFYFALEKNNTSKNISLHEIKNATTTKKIKKTKEDINQIITQMLENSLWEKALKTIEKYEKNHLKTAYTLSARGIALANLGKLQDAIFYCNESLTLDPNNTHTYSIMAMALSELNMMTEAEVALRKAIVIDPQYVIGHYQLGLLLLKNKQNNLGLQSLRNALRIVKTKNPESEVPYFKGLKYGKLMETFSHELDIYESKNA